LAAYDALGANKTIGNILNFVEDNFVSSMAV